MFIYKKLPQNFKVRRLTFRNISKSTKTGVLQRILTLFHRHYSLEMNKKNLWQPFLDNFQTKRTKKSKQIGQGKVALTITGAGVVARKLTFSNNISELFSLEPRPSSPPDLRPSGRGPGKTSILFGEIRASASIFCVLEKISLFDHGALGLATRRRS